MKTTKRQLRKIIRETIEGYDPEEYMQQIEDLRRQVASLQKGLPFRSAGVRAAAQKLGHAFWNLKAAMNEELKVIKITGD